MFIYIYIIQGFVQCFLWCQCVNIIKSINANYKFEFTRISLIFIIIILNFFKVVGISATIHTLKSRNGTRHNLVEDVVRTLKGLLRDDTGFFQQV